MERMPTSSGRARVGRMDTLEGGGLTRSCGSGHHTSGRCMCFAGTYRGHGASVQQTAYYFVIIALGSANVVLAAVAYAQRARQLAGRRLHETQLELAEERNRMAAGRAERLDRQVELLTAIRDLLPTGRPRDRAARSSAGRTVGVIDVGSATVRLVVAASDGGGEPRRIGPAAPALNGRRLPRPRMRRSSRRRRRSPRRAAGRRAPRASRRSSPPRRALE